ncbi:MAG: hypothetical protein ACRELY_05865 [Polyangiaceae bacterium]
MRRLLVSVVLGVSVLSVACGGSSDTKPAASASASVTPLQELQGIPKELNDGVADLTKPIDDTQSVIDQIQAIPKKYGLTAGDMAAMCKATISDGSVDVKVNGDVSDDAKTEIKAALTKLNGVVTGLKATPDKVVSLGKTAVADTAKVPVLATRVTAEATATSANPFGSADSKVKAKADLDSVKQVQADVSKSITDVQAKITGIPAQATGALAKLTATLTGGT